MGYFWLTLKHKWYVFLAAFKVGTPLWRAIVHDLSKFSRHELVYYNRHFCGKKDDPQGFAKAWLHHYHYNDHHWEYWIIESIHSHSKPTRDGFIVNNCLPMPVVCVKEMIADWMGASAAYTGSWDMTKWLAKNLHRMRLHPITRERVETYLIFLGYDRKEQEEKT